MAARLAGRHRFPHVDADLIAREVVEPGSPVLAALAARFGDRYVRADGMLDRAGMGALVFADPAALADLNAIVHPAIREVLDARLAALADHEGPVLLDAALLVDLGLADRCDAVVVVAASPEIQHARLVADRGMDPALAWDRIRAQASPEERLAPATHVVWNEGTVAELEARVDALAEELVAAARAR